MRTLRIKYLSDMPINEDNYKVDFIILEKYQAFSSELLRLSLLGLGLYGFFLTDIIFKIVEDKKFVFLKPFESNKFLFIIGAAALLLAALCALGHRYFSTDCMTHFVRRFRLRKKLTELDEKSDENNQEQNTEAIEIKQKIESENLSFENDLNKSRWFLILSCSLLVVGVAMVIIGLISTIGDAQIANN